MKSDRPQWEGAAAATIAARQAAVARSVRAVIVSIGVLIVVADVLGRRMRQEKAVAGPAGAEATSPDSGQPIPPLRSGLEDELAAAGVAVGTTEAHAPSVAQSLPDRSSIVVLPFANTKTARGARTISGRVLACNAVPADIAFSER